MPAGCPGERGCGGGERWALPVFGSRSRGFSQKTNPPGEAGGPCLARTVEAQGRVNRWGGPVKAKASAMAQGCPLVTICDSVTVDNDSVFSGIFDRIVNCHTVTTRRGAAFRQNKDG